MILMGLQKVDRISLNLAFDTGWTGALRSFLFGWLFIIICFVILGKLLT
jgi:hypothetical protein